ncbi:MAG: TIGR01777 family oxidoreductase [Gammaproteobacteria bacterium]|nr:TIGR01777 family oxidoreductase [Gammaproteobacteria bacterium]
MNILITGGTGFIGKALCTVLTEYGYHLTLYSRSNKTPLVPLIQTIHSLQALPSSTRFDAVINLAGEPIADKRWTIARKKALETSRVDLTADLIKLLQRLEHKPEVLISGSAVGYYGDCQDRILSEFSEPTDEYSHRLCAAWESQALRAKALGVRVCIIRTGLVIGSNGGFLQKLLPTFRLGLGARLGTGQQWMSWIHLQDMVSIICFLLENKEQQGIYNATAPNPVSNKIFTAMLANVLHRPAFLVMPEVVLKMLFGEMSHLLLTGQRVFPKRLEQAGFEFQYPAIKPALLDACAQ